MATKLIHGILEIRTATNDIAVPKIALGNSLSSDPNTIDRYTESTFTPQLAIGGLTAGITYSAQEGTVLQFGNLVFFIARFVITSKGSNSGNVTMVGLPVNIASTAPATIAISALDASVGTADVSAIAFSSGTAVNFYKRASGSLSILQDTDLSNSTSFYVSGIYPRS